MDSITLPQLVISIYKPNPLLTNLGWHGNNDLDIVVVGSLGLAGQFERVDFQRRVTPSHELV